MNFHSFSFFVIFLHFSLLFLHFACNENVIFVDLGTGGSVASRIKIKQFDALTRQLILSELIVAIERLHSVGILHSDLQLKNIVIGSDGHLMITDFGLSESFVDNDASKTDWFFLYLMCSDIFPKSIHNRKVHSFTAMLLDMSDDKLPGK